MSLSIFSTTTNCPCKCWQLISKNIVQHSVGHSDLSLSSFNICDSRIKITNKAKWWQREDVTDIKWNLKPGWGLLAAPSVGILSTPIHNGGIPPTLCSIHQKVIYLENPAKIEIINSMAVVLVGSPSKSWELQKWRLLNHGSYRIKEEEFSLKLQQVADHKKTDLLKIF